MRKHSTHGIPAPGVVVSSAVIYTAGEPPCLVAVPTHFYKVILGESPAESEGTTTPLTKSVAAFVMPNAAIEPDLPLTMFTVPLEALESVSGSLSSLVHDWHADRISSKLLSR